MFLFVGLGNPTPDSENNRHNIGFKIIDAINRKFGLSKQKPKFKGLLTTGSISEKKIYAIKPLTFMNNSGQSLKALSSYYNIEAEEILVIHDDLDLTPGSVKIKMGGGHGGHNGLKDTIKVLDTNDFYRLRLGIGHPGSKNEVVNFVLSPPGKTDLALIEQAIKEAMDVIEPLANGDFEQAMKQLHTD